MPSSEKHPSRVPMWRGVRFAYLLIAMCLYPLAIGGYWAYGDSVRYAPNFLFYVCSFEFIIISYDHQYLAFIGLN